MKDFKNKYRSQSNRLKHFDYTHGYWYYITICTKRKIKYFGNVVNGKMKLNRYGIIAHKFWEELPNHLPVSIDYFIIMPNHMHGIIILENEPELRRDLIHQVSDDKPGKDENELSKARDLINQISTNKKESSNHQWILMKQKGLQLGKVVRHYKAKVSREIRREIDDEFAWQSNYFEHIIRNDDDLNRIRDYIQKNPLKWEMDDYYKI